MKKNVKPKRNRKPGFRNNKNGKTLALLTFSDSYRDFQLGTFIYGTAISETK